MSHEFVYMMESVLEVLLTFGGTTFFLGIASYVFCALSLYTIAQRRSIKKAWLAWIPVVNVWILGSISDQYRYVVKGEIKSKRKVLLAVAVLQLVMSLVASVKVISVGFSLVSALMQGAGEDTLTQLLFGGVSGSLLLSVPALILKIAGLVFEIMALYDVYSSCEPANNVLYLILSVIPGISRITRPLFLFLSRNQDGGMPLRREEPEYM